MPLPPEVRNENINLALAIMLDQLGDHYTDSNEGVFFVDDPHFSDVFRTTWSDLEGSHFIRQNRDRNPRESYLFTPDGWYEAHERLGRTASGKFHEDLIRIKKAWQPMVKGRREDADVDLKIAAEAAGLSGDLIANVIDSNALQRCFNIIGAEWKRHGSHIRIPRNFGLRPR